MDNDDAKWFAPLVWIWGKEKTVKYFQDLVKQEPETVRGHNLQVQLLAAGESSVVVNLFGYQALELQARGAPVEIVQADPVVMRAGHMLLAKRAPHPNAGRFIYRLRIVQGSSTAARQHGQGGCEARSND